jgi:hypothetical protein
MRARRDSSSEFLNLPDRQMEVPGTIWLEPSAEYNDQAVWCPAGFRHDTRHLPVRPGGDLERSLAMSVLEVDVARLWAHERPDGAEQAADDE